MVEPGFVEALDVLGDEEVAVGDHSGERAGVADAGDDLVEVGMGEGLAAGDGDDAGAEASEMVDSAQHFVERDGSETLSYSLQ